MRVTLSELKTLTEEYKWENNSINSYDDGINKQELTMGLWEKVLKNKKLPTNLSEKLTSNLNTLRRATEPDNILFHMVDYEQTYKQFYHSLHEHEHRLSSICSKTKMDNILSHMSMVANIYPQHKTINHKNNPILLLEDSFIL